MSSDSIGKDILSSIGKVFDGLDTLMSYAEKETPETDNKPAKEPETIILTDQNLNSMKWMSASQLNAIFGHGKKKKARISQAGNAYEALRWFSTRQLEAIFGEDEIR